MTSRFEEGSAATYYGLCDMCQGDMERGDAVVIEILTRGGKRYYHRDCAPESFQG